MPSYQKAGSAAALLTVLAAAAASVHMLKLSGSEKEKEKQSLQVVKTYLKDRTWRNDDNLKSHLDDILTTTLSVVDLLDVREFKSLVLSLESLVEKDEYAITQSLTQAFLELEREDDAMCVDPGLTAFVNAPMSRAGDNIFSEVVNEVNPDNQRRCAGLQPDRAMHDSVCSKGISIKTKVDHLLNQCPKDKWKRALLLLEVNTHSNPKWPLFDGSTYLVLLIFTREKKTVTFMDISDSLDDALGQSFTSKTLPRLLEPALNSAGYTFEGAAADMCAESSVCSNRWMQHYGGFFYLADVPEDDYRKFTVKLCIKAAVKAADLRGIS